MNPDNLVYYFLFKSDLGAVEEGPFGPTDLAKSNDAIATIILPNKLG